jgi:CyaY protein
MLDELTFRRNADHAIEALKKSLIDAEEAGGFEAEEQNGVLNVAFDEPPAKFVITPNTPARQIWISALSTSFKLDWSEEHADFIYPKDSLALKPLVAQLINRQLGSNKVILE